ncbi:chaperone NapD [Cytobacillus spongiae]|jgi:nitrate reductase NapD|uniref:chaperone NapD n=1 Tax=Cytobacillus spongiae TaxID=2901381 RepID=UPI001F3769E5|nr:chaperone NapD [Cytobacillus spongiae]UII54269.1 chaperone NapD [Cytobacillus spongiae]
MVISGIFIESIQGLATQTAKDLEAFKGVEVHHIEDEYKIVLTLEAPSVNESYEIAEQFKQVAGVLTICLVYTNFENDPFYQEAVVPI